MSQPVSPTPSERLWESRHYLSSRPSIVRELANRAVDYALEKCQKRAEAHRLPVPFDSLFKQNFSDRIRESVEVGLRVISDNDLEEVKEEEEFLWSNQFLAEVFTVDFRRVLDRVFPVVRRTSEQLDRDLEAEFPSQEEDLCKITQNFKELSLKQLKSALVEEEDGFYRVGREMTPQKNQRKFVVATKNAYSALEEDDSSKKIEAIPQTVQKLPFSPKPSVQHPLPPGFNLSPSLVEPNYFLRREKNSQTAASVARPLSPISEDNVQQDEELHFVEWKTSRQIPQKKIELPLENSYSVLSDLSDDEGLSESSSQERTEHLSQGAFAYYSTYRLDDVTLD